MTFKAKFFERFPALSGRDFQIFFFGQFISLTGTWMQTTTQPYLAYQLTGRPFDLGLVGFALTLPTFFLALPAGALVERFDKRKTVIALQVVMMLQALALAALTLSGLVQLWHIIALSLVLGTANAVEITARQAMLIELVGKPRLPNAIALQATIFNAARVLGPAMVVPFLVFIQENGAGWAFLANGVSYLFVVIGLLYAKTPFKEPYQPKEQSLIEDLREGQHYIFSTASVGLLILMGTTVGLIGFPFVQQIPAFARDVLSAVGDTDAAIAARNSAMYTFQGVGALVAAIILAAFNPRRKGWLLTFGQAAFIFSLIGLGLTRNTTIALVLMVFLGWGTVTQLATMNTLIQLQVPNELRGRVFSTYLWSLMGIAPFGSILIGSIAQEWGISMAALVCGLIAFAVIGAVHLLNPFIRQTVA
ncbi:MAG: MFS transporter [Anaerolineales bacterium]